MILSQNLKYLSTYKFSQDHLELFFSAIRSKSYFNNNPNAVQLEASYKRLIVHSEIKSTKYANCTILDDTKILFVSSKAIHKNQLEEDLTETEEFQQILTETDHDYVPLFLVTHVFLC